MKKFPETSLEAYESMTTGLLSNQHGDILKALLVLEKATAEEISFYLNWDDKNRSSRRLAFNFVFLSNLCFMIVSYVG